MITRKSFIKMMQTAEQLEEEIDRWNKFGINIYDLPISDIPWAMFDIWVDCHFDMEGKEWITWYLWERKSFTTNEVLACYHEDGTEFYVRNPSDLWDLVKKHRLTQCSDSKCKLTTKENASIHK